jgi:hypothetical protein
MALAERDSFKNLFAKLRAGLIRADDSVWCRTYGRKFEIPSQRSRAFLWPQGAE